MIIRRYLARELLSTTSAVTSVLLIVVMSGRFVRYLAEAAAGKLDPTVLLSIMFYRIPGFLELILPLGFMIAILMVYGRLYTDQEMSALFSAGVSQDRILTYTLLPAALISIFVGFCSLWLTPLGLTEAERVLEQQKQRGGLAALVPGKFQLSRSGNVVNYFEDLGKDRQLENVFIATTDASGSTGPVTITADSAQQIQHDEYQHLYLLVTRGERYQGYPGSVNYRTTQFEALGQRLDQPETNIIPSESVDTMPTRKLLNMEKSDAYAA
ncbi:MAG: lipopolysaccharide export system permease protein, partial [Cellvibrionaceae bacterium]